MSILPSWRSVSRIEVPGTAEGHAFLREVLEQMLGIAQDGICQLIAAHTAGLEQ